MAPSGCSERSLSHPLHSPVQGPTALTAQVIMTARPFVGLTALVDHEFATRRLIRQGFDLTTCWQNSAPLRSRGIALSPLFTSSLSTRGMDTRPGLRCGQCSDTSWQGLRPLPDPKSTWRQRQMSVDGSRSDIQGSSMVRLGKA